MKNKAGKKSKEILPARPGFKRPIVAAIYCPLWHSYDHMDSWKGIGWNEWKLVETAKPRFKGHYQPVKPTWGYFDEASPKWAGKEIDLAADHGIDVFIFDWYWYNGVKIMEEALERGFLQAPNRKRIKFGLMWANHDWADYFPAPYKPKTQWNQWLPARYSPQDLLRMIDYCAEHYFGQFNYWKVGEDGLFFSIYDAQSFISSLGGAEKTKRLLRKMDQRLNARGLPSLHWNAMTYDAKLLPGFKAAGFQSATSYNVLTTGKNPSENQGIQPYEEIMQAHRNHWQTFSQADLNHFPVVTLGWDVTPRCLDKVKWPFPADAEYPYTHVVTGNTPRRVEQLCRDAMSHLERSQTSTNIVMINAWNEWTEGCYLLPERRYGTGYLKAVRNAFGVDVRNKGRNAR